MDQVNPVHSKQALILNYFRKKIVHSMHSKTSIQEGELETIRLVDDWWFCPRTQEAIEVAKARLVISYDRYMRYNELPSYVMEAYEFATTTPYETMKFFWGVREDEW